MSTDIAPVAPNQIATLPPASREMAVTAYLVDAHDRLALAVQATGPEAVAALKAEVATAAEATRQLGLSREIQSDAQEMVRRCEYALGKSIRKGQDEGMIRTRADGPAIRDQVFDANKIGVGQFFGHKNEMTETYAMSDSVTDEEFEEALTTARAEDNMSRANVVRKVKEQTQPESPKTRAERADLIETMAAKGMASGQMVRQVGVSEQSIRQIARDFNIDIPADRVLNKTRRIDSIRVARNTVESLDGLAATVDLIGDLGELDPREAQQWSTSLDQSIRALNRLNKKIKEVLQ